MRSFMLGLSLALNAVLVWTLIHTEERAKPARRKRAARAGGRKPGTRRSRRLKEDQ
ncbi:MAG: hypothetical protein ABII00_13230 [Elusimicrobiota bacterium]